MKCKVFVVAVYAIGFLEKAEQQYKEQMGRMNSALQDGYEIVDCTGIEIESQGAIMVYTLTKENSDDE